MTDSNGEWIPFPDAKDYQASHRGKIRSFKRDPAGYVMKLHPDADGYLRFNYTDDNGVRHTNVSVARAVLLAHDPGGYKPGIDACHRPGASNQDNRWPEIIYWEQYPGQNREEALTVRLENSPPKPPKAPALCVNYERCGRPAGLGGRRCHPCVEETGRKGAALLADGVDLAKAAEMLDYASEVGLWRLAAKYGGARVVIEDEINAQLRAASNTESRLRWLRRVNFSRRASRRNSDGA